MVLKNGIEVWKGQKKLFEEKKRDMMSKKHRQITKDSLKKHEELTDLVKDELEKRGFDVEKNVYYNYDYIDEYGNKAQATREIDIRATNEPYQIITENKAGNSKSRNEAAGQLYHHSNYTKMPEGIIKRFFFHVFYNKKGEERYSWLKNLK